MTFIHFFKKNLQKKKEKKRNLSKTQQKKGRIRWILYLFRLWSVYFRINYSQLESIIIFCEPAFSLVYPFCWTRSFSPNTLHQIKRKENLNFPTLMFQKDTLIQGSALGTIAIPRIEKTEIIILEASLPRFRLLPLWFQSLLSMNGMKGHKLNLQFQKLLLIMSIWIMSPMNLIIIFARQRCLWNSLTQVNNNISKEKKKERKRRKRRKSKKKE